MPAFFSKNNTEPYEVIDNISFPKEDIFVAGVDNIDEVVEVIGTFYLIVQDEHYEDLSVEVTASNGFGISFEISLADLIGNPTEWNTKVELGEVDATGTTKKFLFFYRWRVINNLYIIKPGNYSATLTAFNTTSN